MNFNKELLFVAGFIIAVVILIQYLSFTLIKKQIKIEVAKRFSYEKSEKTSGTSSTSGTPGVVQRDKLNTTDNKKEDKDNDNKPEDESYDIDTPEELKSEGDSYVNPLHSEKNVTDDEDN
jgi:hypothetical protein